MHTHMQSGSHVTYNSYEMSIDLLTDGQSCVNVTFDVNKITFYNLMFCRMQKKINKNVMNVIPFGF